MKDYKTPRGETGWVSYHDKTGKARHVITSRPARDVYYIYEVQDDGSLKKLGRSTNPKELQNKYVKFF